jgi:hypothetical protein
MPQYAAKADENQPQIVDELRDLGFMVTHTHTLGQGRPDIVVGGYRRRYKCNALLWVEIKMPGKKKTRLEEQFHEEWADMPVIAATSTEEIVEWFYE